LTCDHLDCLSRSIRLDDHSLGFTQRPGDGGVLLRLGLDDLLLSLESNLLQLVLSFQGRLLRARAASRPQLTTKLPRITKKRMHKTSTARAMHAQN
jgi:hypothetical protein